MAYIVKRTAFERPEEVTQAEGRTIVAKAEKLSAASF